MFSRCVALLLEENAEKISTSSQQNENDRGEEIEGEYDQEQMYGEEQDQYYNQYDPEELAMLQQQ